MATETETTTETSEIRDANAELVLLDPTQVTLFRTTGAAVRATVTDPQIGPERSFLRVQLARAFPLSRPNEYIGLRNEKDKDIGMLVTLKGMDAGSVALIAEELERRYFVPRILRVIEMKQEFNNYTFVVETNRGERRFLVQNMRESVVEISPDRVMITDKDGERYEITNVSKLEGKSLDVFQRFL